jgi:hypothetical protein
MGERKYKGDGDGDGSLYLRYEYTVMHNWPRWISQKDKVLISAPTVVRDLGY